MLCAADAVYNGRQNACCFEVMSLCVFATACTLRIHLEFLMAVQRATIEESRNGISKMKDRTSTTKCRGGG